VCCFATWVRNGSFGRLQEASRLPSPPTRRLAPIDVEVEATLLEPYRMIFGGMPAPRPSRTGRAPSSDARGQLPTTSRSPSCGTSARASGARRRSADADRAELHVCGGFRASARQRSLLGELPDRRLGPYTGGDSSSSPEFPRVARRTSPSTDSRRGIPARSRRARDASELATAIAFRWLDVRSQAVDERAGVVRRILRALPRRGRDRRDAPGARGVLPRSRVKDWQVATTSAVGRARWRPAGRSTSSNTPTASSSARLAGARRVATRPRDDAFFGAVRRMLDDAGDRPFGLDDLVLGGGKRTAGAILDAAFRTYADRSAFAP